MRKGISWGEESIRTERIFARGEQNVTTCWQGVASRGGEKKRPDALAAEGPAGCNPGEAREAMPGERKPAGQKRASRSETPVPQGGYMPDTARAP